MRSPYFANKFWMAQKSKCKVSIDPAVFVILAVMMLLFPLAWVCAWLGAVLIHELGHWGMVKLWKSEVYGIHVGIHGVKMRTEWLKPAAQVFSSLAGPAAGLCLLPLHEICPRISLCAFLHSVYNLLPVQNQDGAVALRTILSVLFGETISLCVYAAVAWLFWGVCLCLAVYLMIIGVGWIPLLVLLFLMLRNCKIKFSCKHGHHAVQ